MRRAKVEVTWLAPEDSGRASIPEATSYATIGRFKEDSDNWPDGAWTVVLEFPLPAKSLGRTAAGTAHFLMPDAPHERLQPGAEFELYEGLRRIAIARVLS